jgi:hypothetical protein
MDLSNLLIGRRLANQETGAKKVTAIEGVTAMGLDGLASSAYGPEAPLPRLRSRNSAWPRIGAGSRGTARA